MIMFKTQLKSFSSSCQCHYPVVINFTPDICSKMILSCLVIIIRSNIRKKGNGLSFSVICYFQDFCYCGLPGDQYI